MTSLERRYNHLWFLLNFDEVRTIEQDLYLLEQIHKLEMQALREGLIFVMDGRGGWQLDAITEEEQAAFRLLFEEWGAQDKPVG